MLEVMKIKLNLLKDENFSYFIGDFDDLPAEVKQAGPNASAIGKKVVEVVNHLHKKFSEGVGLDDRKYGMMYRQIIF